MVKGCEKMEKKKYRIKGWVPVVVENEELLTKDEAQHALERLVEMQPENRYKIEEVKEETNENES